MITVLTVLPLLLALCGIVCGLVLFKVATKEIPDLQKYLLFSKWFLLGLILALLCYSWFIISRIGDVLTYLYLPLPLLLLILFIVELKLKSALKSLELGYYLIFMVAYLLFPQSLLAGLIFLYGLPTGTLWALKWL